MKIKQKPSYEPITITLETIEDARNFIEIIDYAERKGTLTDKPHALAVDISNHFTTKVNL